MTAAAIPVRRRKGLPGIAALMVLVSVLAMLVLVILPLVVVFHEAWGASYDDKYLLDRVAANFQAFADHTKAIRIEALAVDVKRRGDKVVEGTVKSRLLQGTSPFAEGEATIRALSPAAYERIHRRGR